VYFRNGQFMYKRKLIDDHVNYKDAWLLPYQDIVLRITRMWDLLRSIFYILVLRNTKEYNS
jgi:hypothetical protein